MEEEKEQRSDTDHKNGVVKQLLKALPESEIIKWTDIVRQMGAQICWIIIK